MTLADLKKKPVVSMADGAKIGEVDDLVIDPTAWTVREVVVASKEGSGVLSFAGLKNVGPDAATVERADAVAWNGALSGLAFEAIKSLIVVDGTGTNLGHVKDLVYETNGAIQSFEVHHGGVLGLGVKIAIVAPAQIRGLGDRLLTVEVPIATSQG